MTLIVYSLVLLNLFIAYSWPMAKSTEKHHNLKRQVSLDDLVQTTLQLVRPIIDTPARMLKENPMIPKKISITDDPLQGLREFDILGAPQPSDLPICRVNSKICKFISCTAHNFKHDQSLANLNLAAQVLGDKKLRKTFSSNPETITSVCREQGLSQNQCRLFSKAFQLIDRLMSTIEDPIEKSIQGIEGSTSAETENRRRMPPIIKESSSTNLAQFDPNILLNDVESSSSSTTTIKPINPIRPQKNTFIGSRTWSIHSPSNNPLEIEQNANDLRKSPVRTSPKIMRKIDTRLNVLNYSNEEALFERIQSSSSEISRPPFAKPMKPTHQTITIRVHQPETRPSSSITAFNKPVEIVPSIVTRPIPTTPNTIKRPRETGIPEADEFADEYSYEDDDEGEDDGYGNELIATRERRKREKPSTDYYEDLANQPLENRHKNNSKANNYVDDAELKEKNKFGHEDCLQFLG